MSAPPRRKGSPRLEVAPAPPSPSMASGSSAGPGPFLLDFFPQETDSASRLARFFTRLREGRLSTTRCRREGTLSWPPRTVCPKCHTEELDWVDLPEVGRLYAFSAVLAGAPAGMERDVPFAVGLVDLEGDSLRLFGRIVGRPWNELSVGDRVVIEPYSTDDGRVFYRFRAGPS